MGQRQVSGGVSALSWLAAAVAMFYGNLPKFGNTDSIGNNVQIGNEGSVPEMRIWSILLIKSV